MIRVTETGQLVSNDGQPVTAGDADPPRGEHSGVTIYDPEDAPMAKAEKDGIYQSGKTRIKVRAGDVIPAGAVPVDAKVEERKLPAAPENKSRQAAPETKSKKAE